MTRLFTEQEVAALIEAAVAPLREKIVQLEVQLAALQAENERLRTEVARLKKNSSTSSKPPSSDIVKPPPPPSADGKKRKKRRRGGQQGHPRHTRPRFPPEQIDHTRLYELPSLGLDWQPLDEFRVLQEVELVEKLFEVTEHRARCYRNRLSGEVIAAAWPAQVVKAGLVGPRLSALIGYQKGACHMSFTSIQHFFDNVLHLPISRGYLVKVVQKISAALSDGYEELRGLLPQQRIINIDETGHPENGKKLNTWGFHVPGQLGFTFFHIDPRTAPRCSSSFWARPSPGSWAADYAAIYRKFLDETDAVMQFCWAHLIRDVKSSPPCPTKSPAAMARSCWARSRGCFAPGIGGRRRRRGVGSGRRRVPSKAFSRWCGEHRPARKPRISRSVFATTGVTTSPSWNGRAWSRPTTAWSRSFDRW
jgi:transposase